ncbi:MAG: PaaI family thioesterase [Armatimonadota bacterium]
MESMNGTLPNYELCYVCGHANPLGLNVRFRVEGETVTTTYRPDPLHAGYPGRLHGGIVAALLDETMGWAPCVAAGRFCVSVELTVRYLKLIPPDRELIVVGRSEGHGGRIWEASGEVRDQDGTVYARGKGRYFPLSEAETDAIMALLTVEGEQMSLSEAISRATTPESTPLSAGEPG